MYRYNQSETICLQIDISIADQQEYHKDFLQVCVPVILANGHIPLQRNSFLQLGSLADLSGTVSACRWLLAFPREFAITSFQDIRNIE